MTQRHQPRRLLLPTWNDLAVDEVWLEDDDTLDIDLSDVEGPEDWLIELPNGEYV